MTNYIKKSYDELKKVKNIFNLCKNTFFRGSAKKDFTETPQITFLGATKTVTGSKYLLEYKNKKILIDCGLFQGSKDDRDRNRMPLPIFPANLDAIILTHAHLDHTGYIPLIVKNGFKGKIYSTHATYELAKVILPDSGYLQEEDFKFATKHNLNKLYDAEPLYTQEDAVNSLKSFNAFSLMKHKIFHMNRNSMKLLSVKTRKLQTIKETELIVKMQSSLIARKHNSDDNTDVYCTFDEPEFSDIVKENLKIFLQRINIECDTSDFSIVPLKGKKVVTRTMGQFVDGNIGIYKITGNLRLLEILYAAGIGTRRSAGHGKFEIIF